MDRQSVDHLLTTTRAVRRRLDLARPVDPEVLKECIEIAIQAPTGLIGQTWDFLLVTDPDKRARLADIYRRAVAPYNEGKEVPDRYLSMVSKLPLDTRRKNELARMFQTSDYLTAHLHQVPVLALACVKGRVENAGPGSQASLYASIFPCVWSFQLALRSRGIGSVLTTVHICYEREVADLFNIPADVTQAALLPIAYFIGADFKPAPREPGTTRTHWNQWNRAT